MKLRIILNHLGKTDEAAQATLRFQSQTSKEVYQYQFEGRTGAPYQRVVDIPEDVRFHSATATGPVDFEVQQIVDPVGDAFYG